MDTTIGSLLEASEERGETPTGAELLHCEVFGPQAEPRFRVLNQHLSVGQRLGRGLFSHGSLRLQSIAEPEVTSSDVYVRGSARSRDNVDVPCRANPAAVVALITAFGGVCDNNITQPTEAERKSKLHVLVWRTSSGERRLKIVAMDERHRVEGVTLFTHANGWSLRSSSSPEIRGESRRLYVRGSSRSGDNREMVLSDRYAQPLRELVEGFGGFWEDRGEAQVASESQAAQPAPSVLTPGRYISRQIGSDQNASWDMLEVFSVGGETFWHWAGNSQCWPIARYNHAIRETRGID